MNAARQRLTDCYAITAAINEIGPMREPEIAAATGLDEDRVYRACKMQVKMGFLARRSDGEMSIVWE